MPNYYIVTAKVGKGVEEKNRELIRIDPNSYGFKDRKNADKLKVGDKMVRYVAPNKWGFVAIMEVDKWENGLPSKDAPDISKDWQYRVKVEELCKIRDKNLMPKWADLWHELHTFQRMTPQKAAWTLRQPLIPIDEHDYKLIKDAICRA